MCGGDHNKKLFRHAMEMQQMIECLVPKMDANQAEMKAIKKQQMPT
jgi:hypothetical protein